MIEAKPITQNLVTARGLGKTFTGSIEALTAIDVDIAAEAGAVAQQQEVTARPPDWPASFPPLRYDVAVPRFAVSDVAGAKRHLEDEG